MPEPCALEPQHLRVRPIAMKTAAIVAALLVLAGCGSADQGSGKSEESGGTGATPPSTVGGCAADDPQVTGARPVTKADLDGDGTADQVKLTADGGDCGNTLFAKLGEGYVATAIQADEPPITSAYAVALPGREGQLFVTKADHPRGGYQLRVYAADADSLEELTYRENPLVPFVALDVPEHPFSIDCAEDGLVLTEAVPHEPVGVVAAWDIQRTTYAVEGTTVTASPPTEVADNVLPQDLDAKYPDLAKHSAFASCRVAG